MMSQTLLEKILKNDFDSSLIEIIKFLLIYKKGDYIYPSVIKEKFGFDNHCIYKLLSILEQEKLVKMYYEAFCYKCNKSIKMFDTFAEIDDSFFCDNCEDALCIENNIKIVYKVVK